MEFFAHFYSLCRYRWSSFLDQWGFLGMFISGRPCGLSYHIRFCDRFWIQKNRWFTCVIFFCAYLALKSRKFVYFSCWLREFSFHSLFWMSLEWPQPLDWFRFCNHYLCITGFDSFNSYCYGNLEITHICAHARERNEEDARNESSTRWTASGSSRSKFYPSWIELSFVCIYINIQNRYSCIDWTIYVLFFLFFFSYTYIFCSSCYDSICCTLLVIIFFVLVDVHFFKKLKTNLLCECDRNH